MATKPLTPQEIIDRLVPNEYCPCNPEGGENPILSHQNPIRIGDILDRVVKNMVKDDKKIRLLILHWNTFGLTKSLQEIAELDTNESRELFNFLATIIQ